jgi:hypothetical protein
MKHIKTFESINQKVWIVIYEAIDNPEASHQTLFDDIESAENLYLELVNDEKERNFNKKNYEFTNKDLIVNVTDANRYVAEDVFDSRIYFYPIIIQSKHELPENIKLEREIRKYNL